jgi:inositol hexakisphosphate/diphosphoinositol-pentakisphosphate kinase
MQIVNVLQKACQLPHTSCNLFFTKESHVHTLYNTIRLLLPGRGIPDVTELDYLTQISFELYERTGPPSSPTFDESDPSKPATMSVEYSLRIGFSPGAHDDGLIDTKIDFRHALSVTPRKWITDHIELDQSLKNLAVAETLFPLKTRVTPHMPTPVNK